jgi:subtilisin family serine protease
MLKKTLFILFFLLTGSMALGQNPRYLIKLTDKNTSENPYSIDNPEDFLSEKAIQRRQNQDIEINHRDLPHYPGYLDSLKSFGARIQNKSKWMNSLVAEVSPDKINELKTISFVEDVLFLAPPRNMSKDSTTRKGLQSENLYTTGKDILISDTSGYGPSASQIMMLNGHVLHLNGYNGENMTIAVFDGGFRDVDILPAFDSLWYNNQIIGSRDFEDNDGDVFSDHPHGTYVLSILAGNIPGFLYGSAPKAEYYLCRTEVTSSEYLVEEYNWIAAAEFADSAGAEIINSSLGYTRFDDSAQNHTYEDMDGNTTPISKAAKIAASKGILVITSAGNLGNDQWHYISAPGDADSIVTVGAVDKFGGYASFSSTGPTSDGRVKPDVAGQGQGTFFQYTDSNLVYGNGTSFSAPIIAGLSACLWQNFPGKNNMEIINLITQNSHQFQSPDSLIGYGIPDFGKASGLNYTDIIDGYFAGKMPKVYPNPFKDSFRIEIPAQVKTDNSIIIEIHNIIAEKVYEKILPSSAKGSSIVIKELANESPGFYFIKITYNKNLVVRKKIIKTD